MKTSLEEFTKPWAKLCAAYPRQGMTRATVVVYHELLCRYDLGQITDAVNVCIEHCEFFPSVSQIIAAVKPRPRILPRLLDEPHNPKVVGMLHDLAEKMKVRKHD